MVTSSVEGFVQEWLWANASGVPAEVDRTGISEALPVVSGSDTGTFLCAGRPERGGEPTGTPRHNAKRLILNDDSSLLIQIFQCASSTFPIQIVGDLTDRTTHFLQPLNTDWKPSFYDHRRFAFAFSASFA